MRLLLQSCAAAESDGLEDADEAGAAAEISGQPFANLGRSWDADCAASRLCRGHQHARRADAALRAAALEKSLLQRMQLAVAAPALRPSAIRAPSACSTGTGSCSPARRSCAPSMSRTRLRRSLPWCRSGGGLRAARRAGASWAEHKQWSIAVHLPLMVGQLALIRLRAPRWC